MGMFDDLPETPSSPGLFDDLPAAPPGPLFGDLPEANDVRPPAAVAEQWEQYRHHGGDFGGSFVRNILQPLKLPGQVLELAANKEAAKAKEQGVAMDPFGATAPVSSSRVLGDLGTFINNKISAAQDWFDPLPPGHVPWYEQIPSALGSAGAFLLTGAMGKAAGAGELAPNLVLGTSLGATQQYEEAVAQGADPDQAMIALAAGGALGSTDAIPMALFMNRLNKLTGGQLAARIRKEGLEKVSKSTLAEIIKGALAEGTQEGLQQVGQNWVARDLAGYDPRRSLDENAWDSFLTGGAIGSILGGGINKLQKLDQKAAMEQLGGQYEELRQDPINQIEGSFTPVSDLVRLQGRRIEMDAALAERGRVATEEKESTRGVPSSPLVGLEQAKLQVLESGLPGDAPLGSRKFNTPPAGIARDWNEFRLQSVHRGIESHLPQASPGVDMTVEQALAKQPVVVAQTSLYGDLIDTYNNLIQQNEKWLANAKPMNPATDALVTDTEAKTKELKADLLQVKAKAKVADKLTREVKNMVASMREAFGVTTKYVVSAKPDASGAPNSLLSYNGYFSPVNDVPGLGSVGVFYVNLEKFTDQLFNNRDNPTELKKIRQRLFEVTVHEMGHSIYDRVFDDLLAKARTGTPEEAQKAYETYNYIEQGYRQWLKDVARTPTVAQAVVTKDPLVQAGIRLKNLGPNATIESLTSQSQSYLTSLDEFFADTSARLASQGEFPDAALTAVFKPILKDYQDAFEQFPEYAKSEYGHSWLEWLKSMRLDVVIENARAAAQAGGGKDIIDALRGKVPGYDPAKFAGLRDYLDRWNKGMSAGLNLLQMVEENPHVSGLGFYLRGIEAWQNYQRDMANRATDAMKSWRDLGKKEAAEVSQVFLEELELRRRLTQGELAAKLTGEGIEVYTQVRAVFDYILDEMRAFAIDDANKTYEQGSEIQKAEVERIGREFDQMKAKGYFPAIRFGKFTITARAKTDLVYQGQEYKEGQLITFPVFETEKERNRALEVLRRELGDRANISPSIMRETEFAIQGMPRAMLRALRNKLKLQGNLTPDMEQAFEQELQNLAPFRNFRKQFLRKRGIHGASEDMLRSFAYYTRSAGGHIARAKYSNELLAAIQGVQQDVEVIKRYGGLAQNRQEIAHWLQRHFDYVMNPANELAALRGVGFVAYLGFMVKSAFVNLMQTPMVTYPYLAARYGDLAAGKAIGKAGIEIQDWVRHKDTYIDALEDAEGKVKRPNEHKARTGKMIAQLTSEGIIDQSLATELAIAASENNLDRGLHLPRGQRLWHEFSRYSALPFHVAEKLNRYTAAIAAYNLEYERSGDHAAAVQRAKQTVRSTQYENARWNRPEIFRGKKSVFFLFANFVQNTLYFAVRDPGARRWWMMMLLMAGLMGLPGAEDAEDIFDFVVTATNRALGAKNPKFQLRVELREALEELHLNPDLILHGLSQNTFGLGHVGELTGMPIPRLDMSGSLGMGNIIPGTGIPSALMQDDPNRAAVQGFGEVAGAGGNLVEQYYAALLSRDPDDWKRLEKLLPMMAMRSISKATRYLVRGQEATAAGTPIAKFDPYDMRDQLEIFAQGLGFMPSKVALGWERELAARDAMQYYQVQAQALQRQLNWAYFQEDREAQTDVRAAIREYNASVPYPEMKITPKMMKQGIQRYIEERTIASMGEAGERKYRRLRKQVEAEYPDPYGDMIRSDPLASPE